MTEPHQNQRSNIRRKLSTVDEDTLNSAWAYAHRHETTKAVAVEVCHHGTLTTACALCRGWAALEAMLERRNERGREVQEALEGRLGERS